MHDGETPGIHPAPGTQTDNDAENADDAPAEIPFLATGFRPDESLVALVSAWQAENGRREPYRGFGWGVIVGGLLEWMTLLHHMDTLWQMRQAHPELMHMEVSCRGHIIVQVRAFHNIGRWMDQTAMGFRLVDDRMSIMSISPHVAIPHAARCLLHDQTVDVYPDIIVGRARDLDHDVDGTTRSFTRAAVEAVVRQLWDSRGMDWWDRWKADDCAIITGVASDHEWM